mmetsp:Transcript_22067/g.61827  ORF Transcript_22067/g.61827 Transcript_22067/m.61827 type:complete len:240 (+) Transcript_22067:739-1458(+)
MLKRSGRVSINSFAVAPSEPYFCFQLSTNTFPAFVRIDCLISRIASPTLPVAPPAPTALPAELVLFAGMELRAFAFALACRMVVGLLPGALPPPLLTRDTVNCVPWAVILNKWGCASMKPLTEGASAPNLVFQLSMYTLPSPRSLSTFLISLIAAAFEPLLPGPGKAFEPSAPLPQPLPAVALPLACPLPPKGLMGPEACALDGCAFIGCAFIGCAFTACAKFALPLPLPPEGFTAPAF